MKKLAVVIMCVLLLLVGCTSKPDGMSDTAYKACIKSIEIIDDFLDMNISSKEAYNKLKDVENRLPKDGKDDLGVSIYISSVEWNLLKMEHPNTFDDLTQEIQEDRNNLAELINE